VRRREFLALSGVSLISACAPVRIAEPLTRKTSAHELTAVRGPIRLRATVNDPLCGDAAYMFGAIANPTLLLERGATLDVSLANSLSQPTTLHWHGLSVPATADGDGSVPLLPGDSARSAFTIRNRSGLYWYHAHPHGFTAEQVYQGLAGLLVVRDDDDRAVEAALQTTLGETDFPLLLRDASYIGNVRVAFRRAEGGHTGALGNAITVNGAVKPDYVCSRGWVRLRLANASNVRGLLLGAVAQGTALPLFLLGTDGGLLPSPIAIERCFLHPAERIEIAVDCRALAVGVRVELSSLPFDPRHTFGPSDNSTIHTHTNSRHWPSLAGATMCLPAGGDSIADGSAIPLFSLQMNDARPRQGTLPTRLSELPLLPNTGDMVPARVSIAFDRERGWLMNDRAGTDPTVTRQVSRHRPEVWELHNSPISMPHPMHLHGYSFRVLSRQGLFGPARTLATESNGRMPTDLGLKDTVTVWPNERVRIAIDFSHPFDGEQRYMFHCHNLAHEDQMMMMYVGVS
jgi:FtsP/CotA-like multicopper oxidase with cupredoxin domain